MKAVLRSENGGGAEAELQESASLNKCIPDSTSSHASDPFGNEEHTALGRDRDRNTAPQQGSHIKVGPSFQPQFQNDSVAYVRPEDRGLGGLVTRHVGISEGFFRSLATHGHRSRPSIFCLPLLGPYSVPARVWMAFMLLFDLVYTAFVVPVSVAFCTDRYGISASDSCSSVDIVGGVIYLVNFLFMFQCGLVVVHKHMKLVIVDGPLVVRAYLLSWRAFLDFIAVLPFIYLLIILGQNPERSIPTQWVQLVSLIRLLRMIRMLSISKMVSVDTACGRYKQLPVIGSFLSVPIMYLILLVYLLAVLINLEACILILSAYLHPDGAIVFWDAIDWEDVWQASHAYQWYAAMYWAITTSTSTGYGDITPQNRTEKVLSNVMMVLGMVSFGLLIGAFGNLLTRASSAAHATYTHRKKLQEVDDWLKNRGLSLDPKLRAEIEAYYFEFWSTRRMGPGPETSILNELPSSLRATATERIVLPFFKRAPPLNQYGERIQKALSRLLRPVQFFPGQDICVHGHDATRLWVVESGLIVALQHGGEQIQEELDAQREQGIGPPPAPVHLVNVPCLLAESVILEDIDLCRTHVWTYRAIAHVRAWELNIRDLWPLMRMFPEIKAKMLLYVRDRLCRDLAGELRADNDFCELSELMRPCMDQSNLDSGKVDDLISDLLHADIESGELAQVLSVLAEVCTVRPWVPSSVLGPDLVPGSSRHGSRQGKADSSRHGQKQQAEEDGNGAGLSELKGHVGAVSMPTKLGVSVAPRAPTPRLHRRFESCSVLPTHLTSPSAHQNQPDQPELATDDQLSVEQASPSFAAAATDPGLQPQVSESDVQLQQQQQQQQQQEGSPSSHQSPPPPPLSPSNNSPSGAGPTATPRLRRTVSHMHQHSRSDSITLRHPPLPPQPTHPADSSTHHMHQQPPHPTHTAPIPDPNAAPPPPDGTPFMSAAAAQSLQQQLGTTAHVHVPETIHEGQPATSASLAHPAHSAPRSASHSPSPHHFLLHHHQIPTQQACTFCGHVTCVHCGSCLGLQQAATPSDVRAASSAMGAANTVELSGPAASGPLEVAHRRLHSMRGTEGPGAAEQRTEQAAAGRGPGYRQGALLSRLMLAGQGRGPAGAPRAMASPLARSTLAMGSTPLERYQSLGLASIPLQSEFLGGL